MALLFVGLPSRGAQPTLETNVTLATLDATRLAGGGPAPARALANQANYPEGRFTLVQFRDVLTPSVPGFEGPANAFLIEPVFPIFPTRVLPFEQVARLTLSFPTTPNPGRQTGFGDLALLMSSPSSHRGAAGASDRRWSFPPPTPASSARASGKRVQQPRSSIPAPRT